MSPFCLLFWTHLESSAYEWSLGCPVIWKKKKTCATCLHALLRLQEYFGFHSFLRYLCPSPREGSVHEGHKVTRSWRFRSQARRGETSELKDGPVLCKFTFWTEVPWQDEGEMVGPINLKAYLSHGSGGGLLVLPVGLLGLLRTEALKWELPIGLLHLHLFIKASSLQRFAEVVATSLAKLLELPLRLDLGPVGCPVRRK